MPRRARIISPRERKKERGREEIVGFHSDICLSRFSFITAAEGEVGEVGREGGGMDEGMREFFITMVILSLVCWIFFLRVGGLLGLGFLESCVVAFAGNYLW